MGEARPTAARDRVLAATRDCLVERGVAGTTTSEIARRAGVAEGTIFRHFPTKATLLCETAGGVLADVRASAARRLGAMGERLATAEPAEAVDLALGVVWSQYAREDLLAVHELFLAARTDADLASLLDELNGPHRDELHRLAARVLPAELGARSDFTTFVDFVIDGVATIGTAAISRGGGGQRARLAMLRAAIHGVIAAPPVRPEDGAVVDLAADPAPTPEEVSA